MACESAWFNPALAAAAAAAAGDDNVDFDDLR